MTGSRSMISPTVTARIRAPIVAAEQRLARRLADEQADQHEPQPEAAWSRATTSTMPPPISANPSSWPSRAQARVAASASPVSFQTTARAIRPPSSGSAGSRLKTSSTALISASQTSSSSGALEVHAGLEQRHVEEVVEAAEGEADARRRSRSTSDVDGRAGGRQRELGARAVAARRACA